MTAPSVFLPQAFRLKPPATRPYTSVSEQASQQEHRLVHRIAIDGPVNLLNQRGRDVQYFPTGGDHVYCDEISGPDPVWIYLGGVSELPIRLQEGMRLQRLFDKFAVRFDWIRNQPDNDVTARGPTKVVLYVSHGPFVIEKPKRYGVQHGFLAQFNGLATTTPQILWQQALNDWAAGAGENPIDLFGQDGATLLIKNNDLSNTLYFKYTSIADTPDTIFTRYYWYPVEPGETISMTIEGILRRNQSDLTPLNIIVATRSGTCSFAWLISKSAAFGPPSGYPGPGS